MVVTRLWLIKAFWEEFLLVDCISAIEYALIQGNIFHCGGYTESIKKNIWRGNNCPTCKTKC